MTNLNNESIVYDVMPQDYPQTNAQSANQKQPMKKKKNVCARLFAVLLIALCAVPVFLPVKMIKGTTIVSLSFLDALTDLFTQNHQKLFGILPTYANAQSYAGKFIGITFYMTIAMLAIAALLGLITIFCSKKAPDMLRATTFFFTGGIALHIIVTFTSTYVSVESITLDVTSLLLFAVSAIIYLVLAVAKNGKKAWANVFMLLLTAVTVFTIIFAIIQDKDGFAKGLERIRLGNFTGVVTLSLLTVFALSLFTATIRLQTKKGLALDLVFYILHFIVCVAISYLFIASKTEKKLSLVLALVASSVALAQIIIGIIRKKLAKEELATRLEREEINAMKAAKAEKVTPPTQNVTPTFETSEEFVREEYAEALPYDGGPVEGVAVAEEVNPTFIPSAEPPQVQTAGYDFYNCKSFDPFIASLDSTQRNQFTEIFILKYAGAMPEIPNYEVGGNNKDFFNKLFIYLGQYRDRIPDGLLSKIYQFAIKLN